MDSFKSVLDKLGGPAAVARQINVLSGTVQQMKNRDSIPAKYWPDLLALCRKKRLGIAHDDLIRFSVASEKARAERRRSKKRSTAEHREAA